MKKNIAKVHSIESFGGVDGPGIRFVLFLQGCSLACKYCHNRDSWDMNAGKEMTVNEIFTNIMRFKNFISRNGGVTITGGEPLLQPQFLIELFSKLKEENIHTCIDTSGMVPITDDIKELLTLTDLILLDIKHIDPIKCKELVGLSNEMAINFAKYLSDNNITTWIRQVIIPGYTDDKKDLRKLARFIDSLKSVEKVELLPYHNIGEFKWEKLGYTYPLKDVLNATKEDIYKAKKTLGLA